MKMDVYLNPEMSMKFESVMETIHREFQAIEDQIEKLQRETNSKVETVRQRSLRQIEDFQNQCQTDLKSLHNNYHRLSNFYYELESLYYKLKGEATEPEADVSETSMKDTVALTPEDLISFSEDEEK